MVLFYRRLWSSAIVLKQIVIEQKAAKKKKKWLFKSNPNMFSDIVFSNILWSLYSMMLPYAI